MEQRERMKRRRETADEIPMWEKAAKLVCRERGLSEPVLLSDKGSFSVVYRCGKQALKIIDFQRAAKELGVSLNDHISLQKVYQCVSQEMEFLKYVNETSKNSHYGKEHILKSYEVCECNELDGEKYGFILMELLRPLHAGILREPDVLHMGIDVAGALDYIHNCCGALSGGAHRDIKPDNIMRRNGGRDSVYVLVDFNALGNNLNKTRPATVIGTRAYQAPEIILKNEYSNRTDLYSLSAVLYEFLEGFSIPHELDRQKRLIPSANIPKPVRGCSELNNLLHEALRFEKESRPIRTAEAYRDHLMNIQAARGLEEYSKKDNSVYEPADYLKPYIRSVEKDSAYLNRWPDKIAVFKDALRAMAVVSEEGGFDADAEMYRKKLDLLCSDWSEPESDPEQENVPEMIQTPLEEIQSMLPEGWSLCMDEKGRCIGFEENLTIVRRPVNVVRMPDGIYVGPVNEGGNPEGHGVLVRYDGIAANHAVYKDGFRCDLGRMLPFSYVTTAKGMKTVHGRKTTETELDKLELQVNRLKQTKAERYCLNGFYHGSLNESGQCHGTGLVAYSDGSILLGNFKNGYLQGEYIFISADGSIFFLN